MVINTSATRKLTFVLLGILALGTSINLSIKDHYYWSSLLFYTFPFSILTFLSLLVVVFNFKTRKRNYFIILFLTITIFWLQEDYFINSITNIPTANKTVVFWNAAKKNTFLNAFKELEALPDVMILNEYDQTNKITIPKIREQYPSYYFQIIHGKIGLFSKQPITNIKPIQLKHHSFMAGFNTVIDQINYQFYSIDITANIKYIRKPMLKDALSNITLKENTIIVGDFNTPYSSLHFNDYKEYYNHGFANSGSGFINTWFWNLPILSLDHVWLSKDIPIKETKHLNTWNSDHKIITVRF